MPEVKFIVEIVIIVVAIAVLIWWIMTNYTSTTSQFFDYLSSKLLPSLIPKP